MLISKLLVKVVNGINFHLNIELADALTCLNDNVPSTISECPVDLSTVSHNKCDVLLLISCDR